jgi:hypothetical protein
MHLQDTIKEQVESNLISINKKRKGVIDGKTIL